MSDENNNIEKQETAEGKIDFALKSIEKVIERICETATDTLWMHDPVVASNETVVERLTGVYLALGGDFKNIEHLFGKG